MHFHNHLIIVLIKLRNLNFHFDIFQINFIPTAKVKERFQKIKNYFDSEKLKNEAIKTIKNYIERGEEKIKLTKKKIDNVFIH